MFNTKDHEDALIGKNSPGPGTYDARSSLGKQSTAMQPTSATPKFGSENRFQYDYERRAAELPGAGQYQPDYSIGVQSLSKKKNL